LVISGIVFAGCHSNHSVFIRHTKSGSVILTVYIDNILLTVSDSVALAETNEYPKCHFVTKNMEKPKYFLEIEVAYQEHGLLLSHRKYAFEKTGLLRCKPASTPIETNVNLWCEDSHALDDPRQYGRLIEKLIYLTVIKPDIIFAV